MAVQLLDGMGAGLFGALFAVVVADLTRGTGWFNAAQGAVATAQAVGGMVSTTLAGLVAARAGCDAAFLTLSAIAAAGGALFWPAMPETRGTGAAGGLRRSGRMSAMQVREVGRRRAVGPVARICAGRRAASHRPSRQQHRQDSISSRREI